MSANQIMFLTQHFTWLSNKLYKFQISTIGTESWLGTVMGHHLLVM